MEKAEVTEVVETEVEKVEVEKEEVEMGEVMVVEETEGVMVAVD